MREANHSSIGTGRMSSISVPRPSVEKFGQKYSNAEYTIRLKALPDTRARMEKVQVTATFLVFGKGGTRQGILVDKREVQLYIPKKR